MAASGIRGVRRLDACAGQGRWSVPRLAALGKIAVIMAAKGGLPAGVAVGGCIELLEVVAAVRTGQTGTPAARCSTSCCAPGVASSRTRTRRCRCSPAGEADMRAVDRRCHVACQPVRDVLVNYLRERQAAVDFSSLQRLAYLLGRLFWADLKPHRPGISSSSCPAMQPPHGSSA